MDKMLVVVFPTERAAYEGSKPLSTLDSEGDIVLYARAVIAKDEAGRVTVRQEADEGPLGTTVCLLTGTLVGLIGGPAGAAIGAAIGTFIGVSLVFAGAARISVALGLRRAEHVLEPAPAHR